MQRLDLLTSQIIKNNTAGQFSTIGQKNADDVVVVAACRTACTRAKKGPQRDTGAEVMLQTVLKGLIKRSGIDPKKIEDICVGNVLQIGAGCLTSRMGQFLAGIPETVSISVINRFCSSGLESNSIIAAKIKAGIIDIGIGAGVENMTLQADNFVAPVNPSELSKEILTNRQASDCLVGMGHTSDNVAAKYNISREEQDAFAVQSHLKAHNAQKNGLYDSEIEVYETITKAEDDSETKVKVDKDDGIRANTTVAGLSKLKPAFNKTGTTTAGNASQVTDGAAGVLLARRSVANQLGLPILGKIISHAVVGCEPSIMGIGPALAIPAVLKKAGMKKEDIGVFEINEAFASQAYYSIKTCGIDINKVNPKGGAIALGHPMGATGARQIATLFPELKRTGQKYGVVSMCIGSGMGAAGIFESEQ